MSDFKDIQRKLLGANKKKVQLNLDKGLSTGSTLLNLACSGQAHIGFLPGRYYFLVGDTNSGKTWLSLTCLAEASINRHYDSYRFIYDGPERGALMDIEKFFGKAVRERIEPPHWHGMEALHSATVEEFLFHVDDAFELAKPFIYVLDSMDALSSEEDEQKFDERKQAHWHDKQVSGSYGVAKAKANSSGLRRIINQLEKSQSILIIISQTRDKLSFGFDKKTRAGGRALSFYATIELWSSVKEKISRVVRGKKRHIGNLCKVQVRRTRISGSEYTIDLPIYRSLGIDDLGSCVDYLIDEGQWSKNGGTIQAREFDFKGSREQLIKQIEDGFKEKTLRNLVAQLWAEIEEACMLKRKKRY